MAKRPYSPGIDEEKARRVRAWHDACACGRHYIVPRPITLDRCHITVTAEDCIDAASRLATCHMASAVGLLNMASANHPGGGVSNGARAQEEELCRRSNLYRALQDSADEYPIHNKVLVHGEVTFFKYGPPEYHRVDPGDEVLLTVFTAPAVKVNLRDHDTVMRRRIDRLMNTIEASRVDSVVLGAWGCGAFGLSPTMVAGIFKERLSVCRAMRVHFAILDDHNSRDNFATFRDILLT